MEVHRDRNFLLPHAGGKTDLRMRLLEVFKQADTHGVPNGKLDIVELSTKLNIADLKIACEGAPAILDVNGDGKVTMSEICAKLDANEDGTITLKEFTDAFGTLLALEEAAVVDGGDPNVHKLFDAMDTDKDGIVDKIEFLEFIRLHKPKHGAWNSVSKLQAAFGFDRTSSITREKFQVAFAKAGGLVVTSFEYAF